MKQAIILCLSVILFLPGYIYADTPDNSSRKHIENLLVEKGLERKRVKEMMYDPRVLIDATIIIKNLFYSSPRGTAKQPEYMEIDPKYFVKGKMFIRDNESLFSSIRSRYAVSAEIITAILIVESRLGTYPQRYNVFSAYTNLAVVSDPEYLDTIRQAYSRNYPKLNDQATLERAQKKARWALNELYQLIILADELKLDPLSISGSFAGALGPGQFIPSSFVEYGKDGDNDGIKDPFNMADAMASIAYYIKRAGWEEGASIEIKRKAVWHYNHSKVYVNTILMIYDRLKE